MVVPCCSTVSDQVSKLTSLSWVAYAAPLHQPLSHHLWLLPVPCITARITAAGFITFKNLKRVAKELGENLTDEEIQEMIDEADRDGDGQVSEEEFFRIMKKTSLF